MVLNIVQDLGIYIYLRTYVYVMNTAVCAPTLYFSWSDSAERRM